jgi:hypothetical protein
MMSSFATIAALTASVSVSVVSAVPWSPATVLFGTAIKNGPIPPNTDWPVFNHSCVTPPCVITQIHVPSIYPGSGCPWDWEDGLLRIFVDGESTPTLDLTLLQIASVGRAGAQGDGHTDISPFSAELFGKNAQTGGVWTTIRIPFQSTVSVTLRQASTCSAQGTAWIIVRGVENTPIRMSEIDLPANAKLYQSSINGQVFAPQQFITLASSPPSTSGMLLYTFLDATSGDPNYLEGCFHITDQAGTVFLSSGTEDYFLVSGNEIKKGKKGLQVKILTLSFFLFPSLKTLSTYIIVCVLL